MRRVAVGYDAPDAYASLIEPRYAPIADALVEAAHASRRDDVLELGAGTGLVTRRLGRRVRSLTATDISHGMLDIARSSVTESSVAYALVDYTKPLPFLDGSFDLAVSGLTYVQDAREPLLEVARVLRPGGRIAIAMWGPRYHELRLLRDAVTAMGRPRLPSPAPARAVKRLVAAGFVDVARTDIPLSNEFECVAEYVEYRRGFGTPAGASKDLYRRYIRSIEQRAAADATADGRLSIGWVVTILTARRRPSASYFSGIVSSRRHSRTACDGRGRSLKLPAEKS